MEVERVLQKRIGLERPDLILDRSGSEADSRRVVAVDGFRVKRDQGGWIAWAKPMGLGRVFAAEFVSRQDN